MNIWRLIAHHENTKKALEWYQKKQKIAIGWGLIGDLRKSMPKSDAVITSMIREQKKYTELKNASNGGPSLWHFYAEMAIDDLVIISDGRHRHFVMRVIGDYEWTDDNNRLMEPSSDYYHQRSAEVTNADDYNADDLWERFGPQVVGENIYRTLVRCRIKP